MGGAVGAAYADTAAANGDTTAADNSGNLKFGNVACNTAKAHDATFWIVRKSASTKDSFANGATVKFTVTEVKGAGLSAAPVTKDITLPRDWISRADDAVSTSVTAPIEILSSTPGFGEGKVSYQAEGPRDGGGTLKLSTFVNVSWTTGPCAPANTAPSVPGAPTASENPTQGGFTLTWAPSSDAEENAFTYTLEGKDSSGMDWAPIEAGITGTSYTFGSGKPLEGRWTYRVQAVETSTKPALSSGWSASSAPVVVDRTKPNAPSADPDSAAAFTDGSGTAWWKDSVTVTFTGNGDPQLRDGSEGSGVVATTDPFSWSTQAPFTASGTATDAAGNVSDEAALSGYVDTEAPQVTLSCPAGPIAQGSASSATWSASDEGGSGVAGATSGSVALDSSAIGPKTFTLPAGSVKDNVGHESEAATCDYTVIYDWTGFFRPVVDGMNVAKAGSAIPIKFSLHGNQGLDVIASGSPTFTIKGAGGRQTVTAGQSVLTYDPTSDQYTYVWKTDKAWAGKSGTFELKLADGTTHTAEFTFTK
jgi:hypothetical protein